MPLLKTLLSSYCQNDCKFCKFNCKNEIERRRWDPEELAKITIQLKEKGKIGGLFLSSGFEKSADEVTRKQLSVIRKVREEKEEMYIHLRLMPGVSKYLIKEAAELCDRIGLNIESSKRAYREIKASTFDYRIDVLRRLRWVAKLTEDRETDFDSQFIVGATQDSDKEIIERTEWLFDNGAERTYYSAFEPLEGTPLKDKKKCSDGREYRLYQTSFLLRDYDFNSEDLIYNAEEMITKNPKLAYVKAHPEVFPIEVEIASKLELMKVPGIGPVRAERLKKSKISSAMELKKLVPKKSLKYLELNQIKTLDDY